MRLHLDLVLCAGLVSTAGTDLAVPQQLYASDRAEQVCRTTAAVSDAARLEAETRILAEGYTDVHRLDRDCQGGWHAAALADGDPVDLRVTAAGAVVVE